MKAKKRVTKLVLAVITVFVGMLHMELYSVQLYNFSLKIVLNFFPKDALKITQG